MALQPAYQPIRAPVQTQIRWLCLWRTKAWCVSIVVRSSGESARRISTTGDFNWYWRIKDRPKRKWDALYIPDWPLLTYAGIIRRCQGK